MNFKHGSLIISGKVKASRKICRKHVPVVVQKRKKGKWRTKGSDNTNNKGRYSVVLKDRTGRYRAVSTAVTKFNNGKRIKCQRDVITKRHRHKRR